MGSEDFFRIENEMTSTARRAEEYIQKYFKENRNIALMKGKGELGFDFRDETGEIFLRLREQLKGTL